MLPYILDLFGVAVFAASGVLAAKDRELDMLGVIVVAAMTAIGGGTLRDLLLDRHPIFWITDVWYLVVILLATFATIVYLRYQAPPQFMLRVADAFGLGLFAISGAQLTQAVGANPLIVVLMGTMTGVTGGILRDVVTGRVPLILQKEIYATAAMGGIALYLALDALGVAANMGFAAGLVFVVALRLIALRRGLNLPGISTPN